jgi:cytochrome c oxidase assembly factor CtaG
MRAKVRETIALIVLCVALGFAVVTGVYITVYRFFHPHMTDTELFLYIAPVYAPCILIIGVAVAFLPKRGR